MSESPSQETDVEQLAAAFYRHISYRLGITPEDIENKTVADLGCGEEAYLGEGLKKEFPSAHVLNIDVHYKGEKIDVQADAQCLPFTDETFDTVLAHHSVPVSENIMGNPLKTMQEMVRVLKPGGVIRIVPFELGEEFKDTEGKKMMGASILKQLRDENPTIKYEVTNRGLGNSLLEIRKDN